MALFSSIFTFSPLFAQIDRLLFQNYNQSITQLHSALLVLTLNRETGVNPVRSRHCNGESSDKIPLAGCMRNRAGKVSEGEEPESGDLLVIVLR